MLNSWYLSVPKCEHSDKDHAELEVELLMALFSEPVRESFTSSQSGDHVDSLLPLPPYLLFVLQLDH